MISPLLANIELLRGFADLNVLTQGRVAVKHKFGMAQDSGWPTPSQAIQLAYASGELPDLYAGTWRTRLEARCYGESPERAEQVYTTLIGLLDEMTRTVVEVGDPDGKALIYYLAPDDSQADRDADVNVDFVRAFLITSVAKDAVA
jgi:hypothetical protein